MTSRNAKRLKMAIAVFTALVAVGGMAIILMAELKLTRLVPGGLGESFSTKIYSAPTALAQDSFHSPETLITRLRRLNYVSVSTKSFSPGHYQWNDPVLTVFLRGFKTPAWQQEPLAIKFRRRAKDRWSLTDAGGNKLAQALLEPEMVAELSGPNKVRREPAVWEEFPPALIQAVVAVEDKRFYTHHGIDLRSIARAAWVNIRTGKKLQGGSTITQQLAKTMFLTQRRTFRRKVTEAALAIYLNVRYSKERILTLYLNHIYMGQDGFISVAGAKSAAQFYFDKDLKNLTLSESATLAGLIRSPYRYSPTQNPRAARRRRDTVLRLMKEQDMIADEEYAEARKMPIQKRTTPRVVTTVNDNDYFVAEVVRSLLPYYSEDILFRYGLAIYSTMDPVLQKEAQRTVRKTKYQAAIVALQPDTGQVLALSGGKDYRQSQFNRATQARRQPGSAFKPFVYACALEHGFTPASILADEPRAYSDSRGKIWAPQNFDKVFRGPVPLRVALSTSLNGATLDLAARLGASEIARFAQRLGIESALDRSLAMALGVSEVTLMELTSAYAPFANGGFRVIPHLVAAVSDAEGNVLELNLNERHAVLDPALAYLVTSLLVSTIKEGTAKALAALGWDNSAAGKTGTTNAGKDAWFIGYTHDFVVGVWVGDDEAKSINVAGAKDAVPLWASFMKETYREALPEPFDEPTGVVRRKIDPVSGLLARSGCPTRSEELFVAGTEPDAYCSAHAGGVRGWFQRLLQKPIIPKPGPRPETED